ncbi:alpha/beta hydrolase [Alteriqipengyuania sp. WL0013]|uniref:alpha/beta fold hydrolase n=1 Tax=Alteriqipengyuania sp. WL0013 TaxID=3110773 RepID=UPI002C14340C|nr:alpha/beta hydrolase [Alteriqipengyuania sp. WL0013]MEB3416018.1 alpha/beta hydrolase [Alteriqipengyuania sp. WL0013]
MDVIGPVSQTFISQRTRLHYADWGNPDAPPLILQHGGRDHCRSWDWVAEELREDWHVICPDLRGHGDSEWTNTGHYPMTAYLYDFAQLIHQLELAPVTIVAHSLGGNIAMRYAGMYPDNVRKLVAIEGLGPSPKMQAKMAEKPWYEHRTDWIARKREASARQPKRYVTFEEAAGRMHEANSYLSRAQAEYLTRHGAIRNEDGTWSWKFDPHLHAWPPDDVTQAQVEELWTRITCPTRLVYGNDSWASNPAEDGRMAHFGDNVTLTNYDRAGHWVHHDRFDDFVGEVKEFVA